VFSHWEVLEQDPFFQPTTAAEKEEFGDTVCGPHPVHCMSCRMVTHQVCLQVYEGQLKNIARRYMDAVRERKGMPVEKQLVAHAEKQSTMSRKK
jgi:ribosome assembly protein 1